ncbi:MAG: sigma 54-interacting transcriptional regulator [Gammaproteobacteria bacterium]|nr:sigma 54-interacting transcriptional regulator [Gammaproteobacteria bacterium]MCP5138124.1 sigma 54-interacting transcriptional regulator [Gammaproteobacteria bacterium]
MSNFLELQASIETHEGPFLVINGDHRIVAVNQAFRRTLGLNGQNLNGYRFEDMFESDNPVSELADLRYKGGRLDVNLLPPPGAKRAQRLRARLRAFPLSDDHAVPLLGAALRLAPIETNADQRRMIGDSPGFLAVREQLLRAAASEIPVLLQGETGTGKEVAADFIHKHSQRANAPLITVDCTTLAPDLFESELFGHERGAFTGASGDKRGLFEIADGGTLFLDEIGEMPLAMQVKLLRALETGRFRRVGGTATLKSNVRIVCATNRSLLDCVHYGHFRGDLYYRIATFPVTLPPLRDRKEDLAELSEHLLEQSSSLLGEQHTLSPEAVDKLQTYDFPGNVRELRNLLQRAATMSVGGIITARDLELPHHEGVEEEEVSLEDVEARYINELLHRHNGRRAEVAKVLSISERTLYRKLKRFGINDKQIATG